MTSIVVLTLLLMTGCRFGVKKDSPDIFARENLVAWCIVPFDASERTPGERAHMLNDLGINKLAYDYRDRHLPSFPEEIRVMKKHHIELSAVWLWLDPKGEDILGDAGRIVFSALEGSGTQTEIWVSFPGQVFHGMGDREARDKAVRLLSAVLERAEAIGCSLALYNHGEWFGEPANQVEIIKAIGPDRVRLVYNFHHGHHQVENFSSLMELMLPYLSTINLNGMNVDGPKILPLGQGERDLELLKIIAESGYRGKIGIIGHTEGEDIRPVLERNLAGLEKLRAELKE